MNIRIIKSVLCLLLSAFVTFGETSMAMAAAPEGAADAVTASEADLETHGDSVNEEEVFLGDPATEEPALSAEALQQENEELEPSTETEKADESIDTTGLKIVNFTALDIVTGIGYAENSSILYWNKVQNATNYSVTVTDLSTNEVVKRQQSDSGLSCYLNLEEGSYSVSVRAFDFNDYYLAGANIPADKYEKDYLGKEDFGCSYAANDGTYTVYNFPMSAIDGVFQFQVAEKADDTTTKSTINSIKLREVTGSNMVFDIVNPPELLPGEEFVWEISNNPEFKNYKSQNYFKNTVYENKKTSISVSLSNFIPGEICYVRARVYSSHYKPNTNLSDREQEASKYSPYTYIVTYSIPDAAIQRVSTTVSGNSITLSVSVKSSSFTGFQFAKKSGKNWIVLARQTDTNYTDTGLTDNTSYRYRVRGYSYNKQTHKTKYTSWKYVDAATWGASLNVKAAAESSTSVKLSWNKITGANGYEVYRADTTSAGGNRSEGKDLDSFINYKLVKTITRDKTTSYVDKKLKSGNNYDYFVRAYRDDEKNKSYIQGYAYISLNAGGFQVQSQYYTSSGSYKVVWQKMTGIKGYRVEKLNTETDKYDLVKKLSKTSTSYTLSKVSVGKADAKYRIRPYTSSKTYSGGTFTVSAKIGVVNSVKASLTSKGIKVSWNPVAGADYYYVYRTTDTNGSYDKTTKSYRYESGEPVYDAAVNIDAYRPELGDTMSDGRAGTYREEAIKGLSVVDQTVTYMKTATDEYGYRIPVLDEAGKIVTNEEGRTVYQTEEAVWNKGPEKGVAYSYYVVAVANAPNGQTSSDVCISASHSKAASAMFTSRSANKVSRISSVSSKKEGEAVISYKKVSGASGYAVYRADSRKGTYVLISTTTKTSFTDTGLKSGGTYYYKVASYVLSEAKANIYSSQTPYKSVKVK